MKKSSILFLHILLILSFSANSQPPKIGAVGENLEGELLQSDPLNGKQHYKAIPFTIKKGQGVLFTMGSTAFKPNVLLGNATNIVAVGHLNKSGTEAKLSFIAPADTTLFLLLTSNEENKTGKFNYVYKLLDTAQMNFNESFPICYRLAYLINHWQLDWELVPQYSDIDVDDDDEGGYEFKATKRTLKGGPAQITGGYSETMYRSFSDLNGKTTEYYNKVCNEIKNCLSENWIVETEQKEVKDPSLNTVFSTITHFTVKGGEKDKPYQSFKVILKNVPGLLKCEVRLVFN